MELEQQLDQDLQTLQQELQVSEGSDYDPDEEAADEAEELFNSRGSTLMEECGSLPDSEYESRKSTKRKPEKSTKEEQDLPSSSKKRKLNGGNGKSNKLHEIILKQEKEEEANPSKEEKEVEGEGGENEEEKKKKEIARKKKNVRVSQYSVFKRNILRKASELSGVQKKTKSIWQLPLVELRIILNHMDQKTVQIFKHKLICDLYSKVFKKSMTDTKTILSSNQITSFDEMIVVSLIKAFEENQGFFDQIQFHQFDSSMQDLIIRAFEVANIGSVDLIESLKRKKTLPETDKFFDDVKNFLGRHRQFTNVSFQINK